MCAFFQTAMSFLIGALQGCGWPAARVVTHLVKLTAVPAPRQAFQTSRTLVACAATCSAADSQGAQLVGAACLQVKTAKAATPAVAATVAACTPTRVHAISDYMFATTQYCELPLPFQIRKRKRRLDEICLEQHPEYSRNVIQSWIVQGGLAATLHAHNCRGLAGWALAVGKIVLTPPAACACTQAKC